MTLKAQNKNTAPSLDELTNKSFTDAIMIRDDYPILRSPVKDFIRAAHKNLALFNPINLTKKL